MRVGLDWTEEGPTIASDKDKLMGIFHTLPALLHVVHWCPSLQLTLGCPSIYAAISSPSERVSAAQGFHPLPSLAPNCEQVWVVLSIAQVRSCIVGM